MKVWKEMEKQIVHLYLGGDQTLEQIFATLSPRRTVARRFCGGEVGGPFKIRRESTCRFRQTDVRIDEQTYL